MLRRVKAAEGFTLLEVMITVVILAIGLLGLAGLQIVAIKGNSFGQQMSVASTLAQNRLEELRQTSYDSLENEEGNPDPSFNGVTYHWSQEVISDVSHPDWKRVEVKVKWTGPVEEKEHTVTVSTILSNS